MLQHVSCPFWKQWANWKTERLYLQSLLWLMCWGEWLVWAQSKHITHQSGQYKRCVTFTPGILWHKAVIVTTTGGKSAASEHWQREKTVKDSVKCHYDSDRTLKSLSLYCKTQGAEQNRKARECTGLFDTATRDSHIETKCYEAYYTVLCPLRGNNVESHWFFPPSYEGRTLPFPFWVTRVIVH